uniref:RGS domain-containing protein n=2 Tax=Spongospora subterranea TaxID=70186 RepID=A0A0H5R316_9EUKA|eukprot:CRZ02329.1 hypothetical protein [Spongospora subterranea]
MYKLGKGGQASATNDTKQHELERFLRTEKGFAAFKAHLMKEFSVENLLFWSDVQKFKASCTGDSQMTSSTLQIANDIYHKYLAEEAPLEVNLPSELIKQFRQEIFVLSLDGSTINSNTFDKAAFQILELMKVDSLKRFLLTNPPSWSEFQEENSDRPISIR